MFLGLTGSIACGKSTVAKVLEQNGFAVVDFDAVCHEVMQPTGEAYRPVVALFGPQICSATEPYAIDRARLGDIVFADPSRKGQLEQVVNPAIRRAVIHKILKLWLRGYSAIVFDAPLLFEAHLNRLCYRTICVDCEPKKQLLRLMLRDNCSVEKARMKIDAQMSSDQKKRKADIVLDNSGTQEECIRQLQRVLPSLRPPYKRNICFHCVRLGLFGAVVAIACRVLWWSKARLIAAS